MKITTIGRGKQGGALASRWEKAGHQVTRLGARAATRGTQTLCS